MQMKKTCKGRIGNIYIEYVVILGIVSLALIAMNVYMKRGMQGRLADMSDHFIGQEHAADSNPTANVTSKTTSVSNSSVNSDEFMDGSTRLVLAENRNIRARSRVVDEVKSSSSKFVSADKGYAHGPDYPTDEEIKMAYDRDAADKKAQIAILKRIRDISLSEAEALEDVADTLEAKGKEIIQKGGALIDRTTTLLYWPYLILWSITRNPTEARAILNLPPPDGSCRIWGCFEAAVGVYRSGKDLLTRAKTSRDRVVQLREEARRADARIAELTWQLELEGG